jgi:hypothetical protein
MGASRERPDFFYATLLVVTRHPGGPTGRPKIHPVLTRFALFFHKDRVLTGPHGPFNYPDF